MPIYAYKCSSCGHAQDVLQKVSDAPLTVCTACGAPTFAKQLTAAGFQLKGNGWYATDFKNGKKPETTKPESTTADNKPAENTTPAPAASQAAAPACGAGACPACS
jgi:putative FmdB family regulatory protein